MSTLELAQSVLIQLAAFGFFGWAGAKAVEVLS
jgi:hypothetical protein